MKDNLQSSILVAIDMGAHNFKAMAAQFTDNGLLRVLGVEESSQKNCVDHGVVENTTDAGFMINHILKLLSNRIRINGIHNTFVCVGGRTIKVVPVSSTRDQIRKRPVTPALLEEMEWECKEKIERKYPNLQVLDLVPYYYKLDGDEQDEAPKPWQETMLLEAHFMAFVGMREHEERVKGSFDRSTVQLEHAYARPDALLNALASDDDMKEGCAILDLGAQTTTLSVFKGTQYLDTQVVPLGGFDISEAITELGISMKYAEYLKCKYGCALPDMIQTNQKYVVRGVDGQKLSITTHQLATIINEKLLTILTPLFETLNKYASRLKVLYVTGGGVMLNGLIEYIQQHTTVTVEYGSHALWLEADTEDQYYIPQYSSLVGTLMLGAAYREKHPQKPYKKDKRIIDIFKEKTLEIFTPSDLVDTTKITRT
jgi:cell division protein FtsA